MHEGGNKIEYATFHQFHAPKSISCCLLWLLARSASPNRGRWHSPCWETRRSAHTRTPKKLWKNSGRAKQCTSLQYN